MTRSEYEAAKERYEAARAAADAEIIARGLAVSGTTTDAAAVWDARDEVHARHGVDALRVAMLRAEEAMGWAEA